MKISRKVPRRWTGGGIALLGLLLVCACSDFSRKSADFEADQPPARLLYNPDSIEVPLPNDLLNPVLKYDLDVQVPGMESPSSRPEEMDLWIIDEDKAQESYERGYVVEEDSLTTQDLKKGMNARNGFIPEFFTPEIPFSRPLDPGSLVPYVTTGGGNLDKANFFFLDITDAENPVVIEPESYHLLFNLSEKTEPPYPLTFRNRSPMITMMPERFTSGHSFLIVLTGGETSGLRDTEGNIFQSDSVFTLLSSEESFLASDGARRFNLFKDIERIQELEEARVITNHGLTIWETLTNGKKTRHDAISAFQFTISTNAQAWFFDPTKVVLGHNPMRQEAALGYALKNGEAVELCEASGTDFEPSFTVSDAVDAQTATSETVRLFRVTDDETLVAVDATVTVESLETGECTVRLTPAAPLDEQATYLVAANNDLMGENQARIAAEVYLDLARSVFPLVEGDTWLSPYLDVRADVLITLGLLEGDGPIYNVSEENLETATNTFLDILRVLETMRLARQDDIEALLNLGFIEEKEDLVMLYRFRTSGC